MHVNCRCSVAAHNLEIHILPLNISAGIMALIVWCPLQVSSNMTDRVFEELLRANARGMPQPNLCPTTLYILKGLLGVYSGSRFEVHICENECMQFKHRAKSEYHRYKDERCSECGKLRFKCSTGSNGQRSHFAPVKRFWYFTLAFVIRCFLNPNQLPDAPC